MRSRAVPSTFAAAAPTSTSEAPTSTSEAPTSLLAASTSRVDAPTSLLAAPTSLVDAPTSLVDAPTSRLTAPTSRPTPPTDPERRRPVVPGGRTTGLRGRALILEAAPRFQIAPTDPERRVPVRNGASESAELHGFSVEGLNDQSIGATDRFWRPPPGSGGRPLGMVSTGSCNAGAEFTLNPATSP